MGSALQFDSLFSQQHFCSKLSKSVYVHQSYSALSQCRFLDRVKYLHAFRVKSHTHIRPFNGPWSKTTRVGRYQQKHSPTHTHPDHWSSFINLLHLLRSIASSVFSLLAWQSSLTTSLQVLFGLPLGLGPSTSYSTHFFNQTSSSFRSTCPYQRSLFCCNTNAMSSIRSIYLTLSSLLESLSFSLMPHIHLTILISAP